MAFHGHCLDVGCAGTGVGANLHVRIEVDNISEGQRYNEDVWKGTYYSDTCYARWI